MSVNIWCEFTVNIWCSLLWQSHFSWESRDCIWHCSLFARGEVACWTHISQLLKFCQCYLASLAQYLPRAHLPPPLGKPEDHQGRWCLRFLMLEGTVGEIEGTPHQLWPRPSHQVENLFQVEEKGARKRRWGRTYIFRAPCAGHRVKRLTCLQSSPAIATQWYQFRSPRGMLSSLFFSFPYILKPADHSSLILGSLL